MAKPAHVRVVFEGVVGSIAAPLERWAFGINFPAEAIPLNGTQVVDDAVASDCFTEYFNHIKDDMPADVVCNRVKVSRVNALGLLETRADGSYVQGVHEGSSNGILPNQDMPLQTALCVSLSTARAGATGKGRYFLPFPGYNLETLTKALSSADTTTVAASNKAFLDALAVVLTFPPQVVSSKGYMTPVTGIRVGRVPDTMRSRREDLPEGYISLPLA